MKSLILTIALLLSCTTFAQAEMPESIVLNDLAGQAKKVDLQTGKPVLLVFFASWCAPCKKEAPQLVEYHNRVDRPCPVVGICVDKEAAKGQQFVTTCRLPYPILHDPELQFADQLHVSGTPTLLLTDGHGKVLHQSKKFDKKLMAALSQL